ncbi:MAG: RlpA-like double-psi beta-barrel domain-containing protein [Methylosarcina sp.]
MDSRIGYSYILRQSHQSEYHRSAIVRVTDRGPFHGRRDMDLSYAAAKKLEI